jgi:hypothetical protein
MRSADEEAAPVRAQAILIDPRSMTVLWANEAASEAHTDRGRDVLPGASVEQAFPMAEQLGVHEALQAVADSGVAQHLRSEVVAMSRRSVSLVVSMYRLPDGTLLLLAEHALRGREAAARAPGGSKRG